jgi:hypothetical protein
MKTKIILPLAIAITAARNQKSAFLALAVGVLTAASVQAVPTTYEYTGNPFTSATAPYTTSDKVTGSVEFSSALAANMSFTMVTPLAFSFSDGVQTITNTNALGAPSFSFGTGPTGAITVWLVDLSGPLGSIDTVGGDSLSPGDIGTFALPTGKVAGTNDTAGTWTTLTAQVPDTGSTLSLMTLTLMALGLAARRFQRAAA